MNVSNTLSNIWAESEMQKKTFPKGAVGRDDTHRTEPSHPWTELWRCSDTMKKLTELRRPKPLWRQNLGPRGAGSGCSEQKMPGTAPRTESRLWGAVWPPDMLCVTNELHQPVISQLQEGANNSRSSLEPSSDNCEKHPWGKWSAQDKVTKGSGWTEIGSGRGQPPSRSTRWAQEVLPWLEDQGNSFLLNTHLCISFLLCSLLAIFSSGEGNGTPLQYSCLENPMDGGAWKAAVHGVADSRTQLSDFTFTFHFHALEKEMATHSSVLAWRIPGTEKPSGPPSMGSHRVGHDWSDLAAAASWATWIVCALVLMFFCFIVDPTPVQLMSSIPLCSDA